MHRDLTSQAHFGEQDIQILRSEIEIFKREKQSQVYAQAQDQPWQAGSPFLQLPHFDSTEIIHQGGDDNQKNVLHFPAHVEIIAGRQQ